MNKMSLVNKLLFGVAFMSGASAFAAGSIHIIGPQGHETTYSITCNSATDVTAAVADFAFDTGLSGNYTGNYYDPSTGDNGFSSDDFSVGDGVSTFTTNTEDYTAGLKKRLPPPL